MTTLNANDLILNAVNAGSLTSEQANQLIRGVGITAVPGEGRIQAAFASNADFNQKALDELNKRGLLPKQSLQDYMGSSVNNPMLPSGATLTPQLQSVQQGELQTANTIGTSTIANAPTVAAQQTTANVSSLDDMMTSYEEALNKISQGSGTYQATQVGGQTPQSIAAQGNVSELATIQGQLKKLYAESEDGQVPTWAQGAVRKAEDVLAARGLGSSSIAAGAITAAIQESAINIAAPDAATYFQMDLTNLNNEQQTRLENTRLKQQSLLTDTAALNAASQFNASSIQQIEMFQAQLVSTIQESNANRIASIRQFNSAEINKVNLSNAQLTAQVDMFNSEQVAAVNQFNATMKFQADSFNSNQATLVDQSNVVWRRNINTANTASINAANQLNVQNKFNLSSYALNSLWQKTRDEADWLFKSSQSDIDYTRQLGLIGANRDATSYLQDGNNDFKRMQTLYEVLGAAGTSILKKLDK